MQAAKCFTYIPCLNDDDAHIRALVSVIDENLGGWVNNHSER